MTRKNNTCKGCIEREILLDKGIYGCHGFCEQYKRQQEVNNRSNIKKRELLDIRGAQCQAYGRTTKFRYQNYSK